MRLSLTTTLLYALCCGGVLAQPQFRHASSYDSGVADRAVQHCMVMDDSTVYAIGRVDDTQQDDLVLWALDLDGTTLWTRMLSGAGDQEPAALALDGTGGVYVAAYAYGFGNSSDYVVARYDVAGNQLWIRSFDRGSSDIPNAVAVDASGRVAVTGRSTLGDPEAVTVAWDASGTFLWSAVYGEGKFDRGLQVTFDAAGNCYVAGMTEPTIGTTNMCFTACYDTAGNELWSAEWGVGDCSPTCVLVDGDGNCFVSLIQKVGSSQQRVVALKYTNAGVLDWAAPYSVGDPAGGDRVMHMILNPAGSVFLGVQSYNGTTWDYHPLAVNSATPQVIAVYDSGGQDEVSAIGLDGQGNLLFAGTRTNAPNWEGQLVSFSVTGAFQWAVTYTTTNRTDIYGLARNAAGEIALYGQEFSTQLDLIVVRYRENLRPQGQAVTVTAYEDIDHPILLTGTDGDGDTLTFSLGSQPASGAVTGSAPNVTYVPEPDFSGQVSFEYSVHDGAATSVPVQVTINVLPRNDPPTFTVPQGAAAPEGSTALEVVAGFATDMLAGPPDEAGQALHFVVTGVSNPALFVQTPGIDVSTGDLSFQPTGDAGSAVITVVLVDDAGTEFGGSDTSAPRSFVIQVGQPETGGNSKDDGDGDDEEAKCSTNESSGWMALLLLASSLAVLTARKVWDA